MAVTEDLVKVVEREEVVGRKIREGEGRLHLRLVTDR